MTASPNRLRHESSPYLQQHADNPVDWYPWGPEALARAKELDRPILLSVGYSACHWCHVMAHESFENAGIAAIMNEHFVNIKVDREERPDLDHIYQTVCQMMTQQGGWPLTVFLTPTGEPFYAGTYFPPAERFGRPGFPQVLLALAQAWREKRDLVVDQAGRLTEALASVQDTGDSRGSAALDTRVLDAAYASLERGFDRVHGGFGNAPKFPNSFGLELFARHHARTGDHQALDDLLVACQRMRAGGLFDQLGGGFHRYSVDAAWAVPHFEKMLYDNALLPPVYLTAWQASGDPEHAATARLTLDYLLREMRDQDGGFYSTTDADSEGVEGKFFVWTPAQVAAALADPLDVELVCRRYGIIAEGNFEHGQTVLHQAAEVATVAAELGLGEAAAQARLAAAEAALLAARAERPAPFRDEKILAGWNGLAILAFARAGRLLGEPRYLAAARDAANFCLDRLWLDGRLHRVAKDREVRQPGYLDDYAGLAAGLLELFGATGELRWFRAAEQLVEQSNVLFRDEAAGDYFMTPIDAEPLVIRPKEVLDNATPSGLSLTAGNLLRLHQYTGQNRYHELLTSLLERHAASLARNAWGMGGTLAVLDDYLAEPRSLVISGDGAAAAALREVVSRRYLPTLLVAHRPAVVGDEQALPALLRDRRPPDGEAAAFLCEGFTCRQPVTSPAALAELLDGLAAR